MNNPISITFQDGSVRTVTFDKINVSENGEVIMVGKLSGQEVENILEKLEESDSSPKPKRKYIRSYMMKSALVRFLYEGQLRTAAVTHVTDMAWRIMNKDLGVTWIPKNILRWSEISQQFCVIDENYQLSFTTDVSNNMSEYPSFFNPDELILNELNYELQ